MSLNPKMVVRSDRPVACVVVFGLVGAFATYAAVTIMQAYEARDNPPVQFSVEVETYTQPSFTVCPGHGVLWTLVENRIICQMQSDHPEDEFQFDRCEHIIVEPDESPLGKRCVTFHANRSSVLNSRQDELIFGINFHSTFDRQHVQGNGVAQTLMMFTHEDEWEGSEAPLYLPFTAASYVTISKEERHYLNKPEDSEYKLTATHAEIEGFVGNATIGSETIEIHIALSTFNVVLIEEIDPLDVLNLFGVISGVWSILGFFLCVCFTELDSTPQFRARWNHKIADAGAEKPDLSGRAKSAPPGDGIRKRDHPSVSGARASAGGVELGAVHSRPGSPVSEQHRGDRPFLDAPEPSSP